MVGRAILRKCSLPAFSSFPTTFCKKPSLSGSLLCAKRIKDGFIGQCWQSQIACCRPISNIIGFSHHRSFEDGMLVFLFSNRIFISLEWLIMCYRKCSVKRRVKTSANSIRLHRPCVVQESVTGTNPFANKPWILCVCSTSLLKTLWKKEKCS